MPTTSSSRAPGQRNAQRSWLLRLVAVSALGMSAFIHVDLAEGTWFSDGRVTMAGLFIGGAVAAGVAGPWILVRGSRLSWAAAGAVGLVSLLALVVSVYVLVPGRRSTPRRVRAALLPREGLGGPRRPGGLTAQLTR